MAVRLPMQINRTAPWKSLSILARTSKIDLKTEFASDPKRATIMSVPTDRLHYDYSRQLVNPKIMSTLVELAKAANLTDKKNAMFAGERINNSEDRAVAHWALRMPKGKPAIVDGKDVSGDVWGVLNKIEDFSDGIINGAIKGATGKKITNIVSIGIGGSYLGPAYLADACSPFAQDGMNLVFVANVDGTDFEVKTANLDPEKTLFVVVSKTFTTAETIKNAETAKSWMLAKLNGKADPKDIIKKHFVAVSTAEEKVTSFGIDKNNMFGFWDWVGGRYSATSAVGALPLALYLGFGQVKDILRGAHDMDNHFRRPEIISNIPVLSALLDIWNRNFLGLPTRALLPYSQLLGKLALHTQQVEMESNGKLVDTFGRKVSFNTGEIVFGEPGTNGQHSFYQLIHQGTTPVPADFIGFLEPSYAVGSNTKTSISHHRELMTNFLAQPDALAFGKDDENLAKFFPGNRPSSSLLIDRLDAYTAGMLLAWTEHRAATKGFIWGINSFDQFGVELGKKLGVAVREAMLGSQANVDAFNPSTRAMYDAIMNGQLPD